MKTAKFTNFTKEAFTGSYDGRVKTFQPGQQVFMPDYLAKHYAKHLVNRELLRTNADGTLVHKNGDKFTSPKFPEQVPKFMELFNLAYKPEKDDEENKTADEVAMDVQSKNRAQAEKVKEEKKEEGEIIIPPDFDDEESEFEEKPKESVPQ